jgi:hypothetical protein
MSINDYWIVKCSLIRKHLLPDTGSVIDTGSEEKVTQTKS